MLITLDIPIVAGDLDGTCQRHSLVDVVVTVAQHVGCETVRYAVRAGLRVVVVVGIRSDFRLQVADVRRSITVLARVVPSAAIVVVVVVIAATLLVHLVLVVVGDEVGRWQFPLAPAHEDAHENDDQDHNGHR